MSRRPLSPESLLCSVFAPALMICGSLVSRTPDAWASTRFSLLHLPYTPTAESAGMGYAAVAVEGHASFNPAAMGWYEPGACDAQVTHSHYHFRSGPDVDQIRADVTVPLFGGALKLTGQELSSDSDTSHLDGARTHLWGRGIGIAFGRQVTDSFAVGATVFPYDASELRVSVPGGSKILKVRDSAKRHSMRLGLFLKVLEELDIGLTFDHLVDRQRTSVRDGGAGLARQFAERGTIRANIFTTGFAFRPDAYTLLAADCRFGGVDGARRDDVQIFHVGLTREILDNIVCRVGSADGNFTFGVFIKFAGDWYLDYAFANDCGEELRQALGRCQQHVLSLGKTF